MKQNLEVISKVSHLMVLPKLSKHPFGADDWNLYVLNWLSVRYHGNIAYRFSRASNAFCNKPHFSLKEELAVVLWSLIHSFYPLSLQLQE